MTNYEKASISIAAVTVGAVIWYAWIARKQNKLTKQALVLGRRSWVVINIDRPTLSGLPPCSASSFVSVEAWLKNVGGVPGVVQRYEFEFALDPLPDKLALDPERSSKTAIVVYAGGAHPTIEQSWQPLVSEAEFRAAMGNEIRVHFYCVIEYTDCFNEVWRTTRCWTFNRQWLRWDDTPGYSLLE